MRVPEIKTYLTLGKRSAPARRGWPGAEIYLGLKTGVVEAAEGPISSAYSAKFHEAATNVIRTDHLMSSAHITINEKAYAALPADSQKVVTDCAVERCRTRAKTAQLETEDVVRKMAAEGAKVTAIRQGTDPAACQGRRGEDGNGRRLELGPVGPDPEALSRCSPAHKRLLDGNRRRRARARHCPDPVHRRRDHRQVFSRYLLGPTDRLGRGVGDLRLHLDGLRRCRRRHEGGPAHPGSRRSAAAFRRAVGAALLMLVWLLVMTTLVVLIVQGVKVMEVEGAIEDHLLADRAAAQLVLLAAADLLRRVDDADRRLPVPPGASGSARPGRAAAESAAAGTQGIPL
jgi:hypothetical protein